MDAVLPICRDDKGSGNLCFRIKNTGERYGTNGDTTLQPVEARLGDSDSSCNGAVINVKGKDTLSIWM